MKEQTRSPLVLKFGGTSVQDATALRRLADIVRQRGTHPVTVVVSAMSRVTDVLVAGVQTAVCGHAEQAGYTIQEELQRYRHAGVELLSPERSTQIESRVSQSLEGISQLLRVISQYPGTRQLLQDEILSHGERLSALLVAELLEECGMPSVCVDARDCIITDDEHGSAQPLLEDCRARVQDRLAPLLDAGRTVVMGGFIGATRTGATTTLGRGGSDYTAALVGSMLGAHEIQIWTDVNGVLSADPRVVARAHTIGQLSYDEAAELAYFGAKVLHPKTIQPAVQDQIPVRICNSREPELPGTLVNAHRETVSSTVKAIAHKKAITVLQISSARMLGAHGFLRALFRVFDLHRTAVDVITTSEVSVSLSIDDTERLPELLVDLEKLGSVSIERERAIICVVGEGLRNAPGLAARVFNAIGDVTVSMISQGASRINLTFLVHQDQAEQVVSRLHEAFFAANTAAR